MKSYKIKDKVKLVNNPNVVEIVYDIEDIEVYEDGKVVFTIRPDKDYAIPDGGFYKTNHTREAKLSEIKLYEPTTNEAAD